MRTERSSKQFHALLDKFRLELEGMGIEVSKESLKDEVKMEFEKEAYPLPKTRNAAGHQMSDLIDFTIGYAATTYNIFL